MSKHQLHTYRFFRGSGTMILVLLFVCFASLTAPAQQSQQDKKKTTPPPQQAQPAKPQQAQPARPQQQVQQQQQQRGQQQQQVQQQQQQRGLQQQQRGQQQQQQQRGLQQQQRGLQQQQRGQQQQPGKRGPQVTRTQNGGVIQRNAGGRVVQVRTPSGSVIRHAPTGERRVEMVRPGNRVVVSTARGHGYVQRPLVVANHAYEQRTYMVNGRSSVRVYRPLSYHGIEMHLYTPIRYYRPAFYTYAYTPWARPISYSWGWGGNPWFSYYRGYFAPYPVYASPSLWLTDYLISSTLQAAYQERLDAGLAAQAAQNEYSSQGVMTPEVKQMVADEVRRQLDLERAEQSTMGSYTPANAPSMFTDNAEHVFVVSRSLAVYAGDQECTLGAGDVIQMSGALPMDATAADLIVLASREQGCPTGSVVSIQLADLQEMQNDMRATIDQGLENLQQRSGQGGLPILPSSYAGTVNASFASQVKADADVNNQLNQAAQDADRAEQEVINQGDNPPPGGVVPKTISLGQTISEVVDILGQPVTIVNLGSKVIYTYKDLKITFVDGRVTDVQ
jgi:hypothetical protein